MLTVFERFCEHGDTVLLLPYIHIVFLHSIFNASLIRHRQVHYITLQIRFPLKDLSDN